MEKLRSLKPNILFHLLLNAVVVIFITGASYYHTPLEGLKDKSVYFLHLLALQSTVAGILYFLSLQKWLFRIGFSILFLLFCSFSFWAYSQDVSVTPGLIQAILETQPDIVMDLITLPYALFMAAAALVLVFLLKRYKSIQPRRGFLGFLIPALLCLAFFFFIENIRPGSVKNRLPYSIVAGVSTYFSTPNLKLRTDFLKVKRSQDAIKVVFVLGETVRADHLGLNGYHRATTPLLAAEKNLISFKHLYTSNTYTATSVPQILTDRNLFEEKESYTSVYSIANKAEVATTWIGNQTLEKSFSPIVETNDNIILVDAFKSEFSFRKALDEALLVPLDSILPKQTEQLITLHMIGSHWWYENRYSDSFRKYNPVIDSKYVPSQSKEQMINSYDNTILYLDFFLDSVIERLKEEKTPSVMVYVSDHGELLGEDGKWLHAQPGEALENPAFLIWFSDEYTEKHPEHVLEIQSKGASRVTTDIVYPLLLKLLSIDYIN
jgi:lipid A ethanolaminephosphotransferase